MKVDLTKAEIDALLRALGNHLDGDEQDRLGLWLTKAAVKAAERARNKLRDAA